MFFCDAVVCLVAEKKNESHIEGILRSLSLEFEFFYGKEDEMLKEKYKKGVNRLLVLRDDVVINMRDNFGGMVKRIERFLENHKWDIFLLGTTPNIFQNKIKTVSPYIYGGKFLQRHSYIISRKYMREIGKKEGLIYVHYPNLFYKSTDTSLNKLAWMYALNINVPILQIVFVIFLVLYIKLVRDTHTISA